MWIKVEFIIASLEYGSFDSSQTQLFTSLNQVEFKVINFFIMISNQISSRADLYRVEPNLSSTYRDSFLTLFQIRVFHHFTSIHASKILLYQLKTCIWLILANKIMWYGWRDNRFGWAKIWNNVWCQIV
jgi:hypothetical protein